MKRLIIFYLSILLLSISLFAQNDDSVKTYTLKDVTVTGHKYSIDRSEFPVEQSNLGSILKLGGFNLINEGVSLAKDIYADGLKSSDYTIVVDGERYQSAGPMRMDAPISRINPIDIQSMQLVKSSANLQSGLGGIIAIHTSPPTNNLGLEGSLTRLFGRSDETDLALSVEKFKNRFSIRYVQGSPYETGDDKSFKDLYGYQTNKKYQFGEVSYYGILNDWKYSASVMYTSNISFPYLQMDERHTIDYNASLAYKGYKIYVNYTDHLMNNGLRISPMFMETSAKNLTLGLVSNNFEMYYRHWNADNSMTMNNGAMYVYNNMIPKLNLYSANYFKDVNYSGFTFSGKIGLSYSNIGNKSVMSFYKTLYDNAKSSRLFPLASLNISRSDQVGNEISLSSQVDVTTNAPEPKALFTTLKRPMGMPYWSGNPNLDEPLRATIKGNLSLANISLGAYGSYIYNYVYLVGQTVGMQKYQTFGNINALIAGLTLHFNLGKYIESDASYTYGENTANHKALIEIYPLQISTKITSPDFDNIKLYFEHTYNNAQKRIDPALGEIPSSAWNTINVGMTWKYSSYVINVVVDNILNNNYSEYLSYERDPFSNGMRVIEPGFTFRTNIRYYY
jgi:iron complex outermembrane recepter protein